MQEDTRDKRGGALAETLYALPMETTATSHDETMAPTNAGGGTGDLGLACHFPDGSSFPLVSCREAGPDHLMVRYFLDGKPQVLWVPRGFVDPR